MDLRSINGIYYGVGLLWGSKRVNISETSCNTGQRKISKSSRTIGGRYKIIIQAWETKIAFSDITKVAVAG